MLTRNQVAQLLHVVPTFTLVDRQGVPFMVVGEDAKVTGYFFTTYEEAQRILTLATRSADRSIRQAQQREQQQQQQSKQQQQSEQLDPEQTINPWKLARVSTIPLDTAVALSLNAGRGDSPIRNYFQVAPAVQDLDDALAVSGQDDLPEGKVPLFYYKDFTLNNNNNDNNGSSGIQESPVYFHKDQLEAAYRQAHPKQQPSALPDCQVTELFALLTAMVQSPKNEDLRHVVLVPPPNSAQRVAQCQRQGGTDPPFVLGQRNIVL